jgi:hypothetical protein
MPNSISNEWNYNASNVGLVAAQISLPIAIGVSHQLTEIGYKVICIGAPGGVFVAFIQVVVGGVNTLFSWPVVLDMTTPGEVSDTLSVAIPSGVSQTMVIRFSAAPPNVSIGESLRVKGYAI